MKKYLVFSIFTFIITIPLFFITIFFAFSSYGPNVVHLQDYGYVRRLAQPDSFGDIYIDGCNSLGPAPGGGYMSTSVGCPTIFKIDTQRTATILLSVIVIVFAVTTYVFYGKYRHTKQII